MLTHIMLKVSRDEKQTLNYKLENALLATSSILGAGRAQLVTGPKIFYRPTYIPRETYPNSFKRLILVRVLTYVEYYITLLYNIAA